MWHEARRQERKIRGMLVDYRRRAERRRDFYEKIKADPTQFLQLHGRPCKIHLDPTIAAAADSPATMMPWQGQADTLIDRFDVRAHLDFIPPLRNQDEDNPSYEERQCNYERYRILAQNVFLGISEDKFLKQLHLEEQFGYTPDAGDKDKKRKTGAAIGFNYDDPSNTSNKELMKNESSSEEESDSDLDVDLCIDVSKVEQSQAHEMNKCGQQFGMCSNDFYSFLTNDMEEAENIRLAREEEHEKALFSGRKSRRERRAHREKRLANRVLSPPSYAARESPTYSAFRESKSRSKSASPVNTGQITYITSFGDDEDPAPSTSSKTTYADKLKYGKSRKYRRSRSRSHSRSRYRRRRNSRRRYSPRRRSRRSRRSRSSSGSSSSVSQSSSSSSKSKSKSRSKSRSKSKTPEEVPKPPTIQRYYGRRLSDKSSELEDSEDEDPVTNNQAPSENLNVSKFGNSGCALKSSLGGASSSTSSSAKLTPQERLKRKMQLLLNKQYKADKIAEQIRTERAQQEQRNREDELREMALKLRRKQRERRHAYDENNSNNSSDSESSSTTPPNPQIFENPSPPVTTTPSPVIPDKKLNHPEDRERRRSPKFKDRVSSRSRDEEYRRDRPRNRYYSRERGERDRNRDERDRDRSDRDRDRERRRHRSPSSEDNSSKMKKHRSLVDY